MAKFWGKKIMPKITGGDQRKAGNWFKKKWQDLTTVKGKRNATQRPEVGKMYLAGYDAKWKAILPVWDRQPIILPFNTMLPDRFYSLNFHYLPLIQRYRLLSALNTLASPLSIDTLQMMKRGGFMDDLSGQLTGDVDDTEKRMILTWQLIKRVAESRHYKATVHCYLYKQFLTQFSYIPPREWKVAIALPTAKWVGGKPY